MVVQIDATSLSRVFSAPMWLRDLGLLAWFLVGVGILLVGVIVLLGLTSTIVVPVTVGAILATVAGPLVTEAPAPPCARALPVQRSCCSGSSRSASSSCSSSSAGSTSNRTRSRTSLSEAVDTIEGWVERSRRRRDIRRDGRRDERERRSPGRRCSRASPRASRGSRRSSSSSRSRPSARSSCSRTAPWCGAGSIAAWAMPDRRRHDRSRPM